MTHSRNPFTTPTTPKEVALTRGLVALVDGDDYERVNSHKWHAYRQHNKYGDNYYARRNVYVGTNWKQTSQTMPRFILGITDTKTDIDHINHNTLDNRKCNLRICTHRQNMQNKTVDSKCSLYVGVTWLERKKRWRSQIQINGVRVHLGLFRTEIEAYAMYLFKLGTTGETPISEMIEVVI